MDFNVTLSPGQYKDGQGSLQNIQHVSQYKPTHETYGITLSAKNVVQKQWETPFRITSEKKSSTGSIKPTSTFSLKLDSTIYAS